MSASAVSDEGNSLCSSHSNNLNAMDESEPRPVRAVIDDSDDDDEPITVPGRTPRSTRQIVESDCDSESVGDVDVDGGGGGGGCSGNYGGDSDGEAVGGDSGEDVDGRDAGGSNPINDLIGSTLSLITRKVSEMMTNYTSPVAGQSEREHSQGPVVVQPTTPAQSSDVEDTAEPIDALPLQVVKPLETLSKQDVSSYNDILNRATTAEDAGELELALELYLDAIDMYDGDQKLHVKAMWLGSQLNLDAAK
eukprot:GFYU01038271.1.p1 GENE.GFYU01038271.1~~GFYU01038271.1.p1  ORF type:complete len:282 (-),score=95.19 GFYU01038271.1:112-861(-)